MYFSYGTFSIAKVISISVLLFPTTIINLYKSITQKKDKKFIILVNFIIYSITIQIIFGLIGILLYSNLRSDDSATPLNRFCLQFLNTVVTYVIAICIYYYGYKKPSNIVRPFILSIKIMLTVSIYELLAIYIGLEPLKLYLSGEVSTVNQNFTELLGGARIHSIAGEPRFYAVILAVLFCSIFYYFMHYFTSYKPLTRLKYFFLLFYLVILIIYTQSTSGIIQLTILFSLLFLFTNGIKNKVKYKMLFFLVFILICIFPIIKDVVVNRVFDRIDQEMLSDQYMDNPLAAYVEIPILGPIAFDATDASPIALLIDKPYVAFFGLGRGNISTFVKPYLPFYGGYWGYDYQGIVEPNQVWLKSILNLGLIGNGILLYLFYLFHKDYSKNNKSYNPMTTYSYYLVCSIFICTFSLSSPMLEVVWFFAFHAGILANLKNI